MKNEFLEIVTWMVKPQISQQCVFQGILSCCFGVKVKQLLCTLGFAPSSKKLTVQTKQDDRKGKKT